MLEGACRLVADEAPPIRVEAGDFVLIPSTRIFAISSLAPGGQEPVETVPIPGAEGEMLPGRPDAPVDVRMIVGPCTFASPDLDLLASLLPEVVHVRGDERLGTLVHLLREEWRARRAARAVILARLLEVPFIEALRHSTGGADRPGLLRGLADERLARAIRCMHERPAASWTVSLLAREAARSRSAFFDRFRSALGVSPMGYLLDWRITLSKHMLGHARRSIAEVAERVGCSSANTFSAAFGRHVGAPPATFARRSTAASGNRAGDRT